MRRRAHVGLPERFDTVLIWAELTLIWAELTLIWAELILIWAELTLIRAELTLIRADLDLSWTDLDLSWTNLDLSSTDLDLSWTDFDLSWTAPNYFCWQWLSERNSSTRRAKCVLWAARKSRQNGKRLGGIPPKRQPQTTCPRIHKQISCTLVFASSIYKVW